ncbi:hypothetical protein HOY82DRAFT_599378 [Tuber indicum]|nr:hypothetical protein HOY82DRAFT_599378 [Tuber indicum]
MIKAYTVNHDAKLVDAGVTIGLEEIWAGIFGKLWRDLDIVSMPLRVQMTVCGVYENNRMISIDVAQPVAGQGESASGALIPTAIQLLHFLPGIRYIPQANLEHFRVIETNHNILQGVADPKAWFDAEKQALLNE